MDVPAWEGNGDDLWGEEEEVAVPRVSGLSLPPAPMRPPPTLPFTEGEG